ncbi:MAG: hypothetical protein HYS33_07195 [Acidobacteria bacterium]|nr:hypothetical protein [Acidobacteriota bacterium]
MGYIIVEYLAYLALVATLGALLFGASATYLLAQEGAKLAARAARKAWHGASSMLARNAAGIRAFLHRLIPYSH